MGRSVMKDSLNNGYKREEKSMTSSAKRSRRDKEGTHICAKAQPAHPCSKRISTQLSATLRSTAERRPESLLPVHPILILLSSRHLAIIHPHTPRPIHLIRPHRLSNPVPLHLHPTIHPTNTVRLTSRLSAVQERFRRIVVRATDRSRPRTITIELLYVPGAAIGTHR